MSKEPINVLNSSLLSEDRLTAILLSSWPYRPWLDDPWWRVYQVQCNTYRPWPYAQIIRITYCKKIWITCGVNDKNSKDGPCGLCSGNTKLNFILFSPCILYNSQITYQRNALYFHFMFFILQPLHMFRPLQGHLQGARKLQSLHIQCFCLLSHLVIVIYITVIYNVCN